MVRLVLLKFFESYFQHRWLYLLPIVAMLAAGSVFIATSPVEYVSRGTLYVEKESLLASLTATPADGSWWVSPAQTTINEINELMATRSFVRSAIQRTSLEAQMSGGPEQVDRTMVAFRQMLSMQPLGDKLVQISATSEDAQLAQQVVNATLEAYLQWKINADYQESVVAQGFFANLIKPYEEELQRTRDELMLFLQDYPDPVRGERPADEVMELQRLQAEVTRAEERVDETLKNEESARLALAKSEAITRQAYTVIDVPEAPTEPEFSLRKLAMDIVVYAGIGFALSFGAIVVGALIDRTFRFPIDARQALSLPVLAVVPDAGPQDRASTSRRGKKSAKDTARNATVPELQPQLSTLHNTDPQ